MFLLIARYPIQYDNCKIPYTYTYNNFHIPFHSSCIFHVYRVYGLPHMAHIDTHLFTLGRLRDLCRLVNQLSTPLHSPLPIPCFSPSPRSLHIFRQWIVHLHSSHALPKYFDSARTCQRRGARGRGALCGCTIKIWRICAMCLIHIQIHIRFAVRLVLAVQHIGNRLSFIVL